MNDTSFLKLFLEIFIREELRDIKMNSPMVVALRIFSLGPLELVVAYWPIVSFRDLSNKLSIFPS